MVRIPYPKTTLAILLAALGLTLFLTQNRPPQPPPPAPQPLTSTRIPPPEVAPLPKNLTRLPSADLAAQLNNPDESPEEDLAIIDLLLTEYRRHFNGNPVGENEEITAALTGKNPKGLTYLPANSPAIDPQGRLTDRWGSPYFFHAIAAHRMQITSPGPDRQPHTKDDLTLER